MSKKKTLIGSNKKSSKSLKAGFKKFSHVFAPYPHFRFYKKSGHPALIVGEQPVEEYRFRKVMHSERDGGRPNEKVSPNPDRSDREPMYISKRVRHDKKSTFEDKPLSWKYPNKKKK